MDLATLLSIFDKLQTQNIFTAAQVTKLKTAANSMLTQFSSAEEYQAKYILFLALLGGKASI